MGYQLIAVLGGEEVRAAMEGAEQEEEGAVAAVSLATEVISVHKLVTICYIYAASISLALAETSQYMAGVNYLQTEIR
jgi:hypothetical protein